MVKVISTPVTNEVFQVSTYFQADRGEAPEHPLFSWVIEKEGLLLYPCDFPKQEGQIQSGFQSRGLAEDALVAAKEYLKTCVFVVEDTDHRIFGIYSSITRMLSDLSQIKCGWSGKFITDEGDQFRAGYSVNKTFYFLTHGRWRDDYTLSLQQVKGISN